MMKNPLIEMAEYHEGQSAYALEYHTRNVQARSTHQLYLQKAAKHANDARILRAAAAVILQMQALRGDIQERKIFWPAEVDFAVEALDSYEAACKEEPK